MLGFALPSEPWTWGCGPSTALVFTGGRVLVKSWPSKAAVRGVLTPLNEPPWNKLVVLGTLCPASSALNGQAPFLVLRPGISSIVVSGSPPGRARARSDFPEDQLADGRLVVGYTSLPATGVLPLHNVIVITSWKLPSKPGVHIPLVGKMSPIPGSQLEADPQNQHFISIFRLSGNERVLAVGPLAVSSVVERRGPRR